MKNRIRIATAILFFALLSTVILVVSSQNNFIVATGFVISLLSLCWLLYSLHHFLQSLANDTDMLLSQKQNFDKNIFDKLAENQKLIRRKFDLTAQYIKQIDSTQSTDEMDVLVKNDAIGEAIHSVKNQLHRLKVEDDKRSWVNQGMAHFSEILRNKSELSIYTQAIISQLVRYLGANQGALFLKKTDQDERYMEMVACYAYEKKKFLERRVNEGEGILGQCMLERDFVFITDVPGNYVKITSGLGEATPRNIVVAPLVFNGEFYGAIELALFDVMPSHHVEFLKRVVENIASEMASLQGYEHTQHLLNESKNLTAELQTREEEMKQNLEELAATQEEMARKQSELSGIIHAIDSTLATAEFSLSGQLVRANSLLADFLKSTTERLLSTSYTLLMQKQIVPWKEIVSGKIKAGDFETLDSKGNSVWLSITFTPMFNARQEVDRVLCMIQDITGKKNKEIEFERLSLVANNTDNSVIITDANGITEYVNEGFTKMTGFSPHEIIGKKPGHLLQGPLTDKDTVDKLRVMIAGKEPVFEEILNYNKSGETYWVSLAINPVTNSVGEVEKYISIQADITETKMRALDFHQKMKALSKSNAIMEIDLDGNIIEINDNYAHLLGYEIDELQGRPYSVITGRDHIFSKLLAEVKANGLQNGEYKRFNKSGGSHCMRLMDYPVVDLKGDLIKIIEFGVDVSKQKLLEKEAARKQVELNSYLSAINNTIASAEFDLAGNFVAGNDIFLAVMGYKQDELQGKHYQDIMPDEANVHLMWENLRLGKFFSGEFKLKNRDERELWLTGTFNPILVQGEVPEKIMMFAQFTTQEKEKINDLSSVVNSLKATLPVVEFNENFSCKTANERFLKLFSLTRTELRGKFFNDFVDEYYKSVFTTIQKDMLNQEYTTMLIPFTTPDKTATFETSLTVIRNLEGKITRLVFILIKVVEEQIPVMAVV